MLPISDTIRSSTPSLVNRFIVVVNLAVFAYMVLLAGGDLVGLNSREAEAFIYRWAFRPATLESDPGRAALTILTSMFMHGGLSHIGFNLLFLWVFGDNIEDRLGHLPYLIFYLVGGAVAAIAQATFAPGAANSVMLGASGAIGAVLGAYLMLHPSSGIRTLILPFFFVTLPAFIYLPFWAYLQYASLGNDGAGVAFFAHLGGFVFGFLVVRLIAGRAPQDQARPPGLPG